MLGGQDRALDNPARRHYRGMRKTAARQLRVSDIGQRLGGITVRVAEVTVGGVGRCVSRRVHGETGVPDQQAEQQDKTELTTRVAHGSLDQCVPGMFKPR